MNVPARSLRQEERSGAFWEGSAAAVVLAPDGGSACACEGARVGREGHIAVAGAGEICLAPEPDPSVKTCRPLNPVMKIREGDDGPYPDLLPPYPYERTPLP